MHFEAQASRQRGTGTDACPFLIRGNSVALCQGLAPRPGMDFNHRRRNTGRAGSDRRPGRLHWIGMPPAARIADRRDMIDIDAEANGKKCWHVPAHAFTRSALATTSFARNCAMIEVRCLMS